MKRSEAYWILHEMMVETFSADQSEALLMALHDIQFVDLMPNDTVPVVRCKDCVFRSDLTGAAPFMYHYCHRGVGLSGEVKDYDFCSYGERKDGEG